MALVTISDFTHAQYVVRPSPVIDPATVPTTVTLAGLLIVRHTQDSDTATDMIRNARMGVTVRPRSTLVLKFQVDFAGAGRLSRDSTVNGFAVTDALTREFGLDEQHVDLLGAFEAGEAGDSAVDHG